MNTTENKAKDAVVKRLFFIFGGSDPISLEQTSSIYRSLIAKTRKKFTSSRCTYSIQTIREETNLENKYQEERVLG